MLPKKELLRSLWVNPNRQDRALITMHFVHFPKPKQERPACNGYAYVKPNLTPKLPKPRVDGLGFRVLFLTLNPNPQAFHPKAPNPQTLNHAYINARFQAGTLAELHQFLKDSWSVNLFFFFTLAMRIRKPASASAKSPIAGCIRGSCKYWFNPSKSCRWSGAA